MSTEVTNPSPTLRCIARARRMLDRLRALGVDVDGPGYSLDRVPRVPDEWRSR